MNDDLLMLIKIGISVVGAVILGRIWIRHHRNDF
jgi:hypothetical protein